MFTVSSRSPGAPVAAPRDGSLAGIRRVGLWVFFVSIGVNALVGIFSILSPHFGETARRTLSSSLMVTAFLLACLAVGPAWERRRLWPLAPVTTLVCSITLIASLTLVWEVTAGRAWEKAATSLAIVSAAGVVACLLGLARLRPAFRLLLSVDLGLLGLATVMLVRVTLTDGSSEAFGRALGVVMVLLGAAIVATPVLHWLGRPTWVAEEAREGDGVCFCPFCGGRVSASLGGCAVCGRCGQGFTVTGSSASSTPPRQAPELIAP